MRLNLILGFVWLGIGLAMLFPQVSGWQTMALNVANVSFSAGWLILAMSAYNFLRWYVGYSSRSQQERNSELNNLARRSRRQETPPTDPDPNFDFRDPPASK